MKNNKKSRFNLYEWLYKRDHKEEADDDSNAPRTFGFFFKLFGRNFSRLLSVNLYFTFGNIGLILLLLLLGGIIGPRSSAPTSDLFAPLYGASQFADASPLLGVLLSVHATFAEISVMTPFIKVLIGIAILLVAATFGPVMAGLSINLRSMVKGEPLFMWTDFWHAVKANLKQSILLGILDIGIIALLLYGTLFYYMNLGATFILNVFFLFTLVMLVFYLFMRKYLYLMMITFELSIPKLFKNALFFSLLGLGRNIISTVACIGVVLLNLMIFFLFIPVGMILPFVLTVGICLFIDAYAAWPKIQSVMIDPYIGDGEDEESEDPESED